MAATTAPETVETVIIGGGQAGLALAYELKQRGHPALVLEAHERVGDAWRGRWDSLRLFTPSKVSHLPGRRLDAPAWSFPTKDEFADYLQEYARAGSLDVRTGCRVTGLTRRDDCYVVEAGERQVMAEHVALATGGYQEPKLPVFAPELARGILQMHSAVYRNPAQLLAGDVLVVGAGNSGSEIALEIASTGDRAVYLAGTAPLFPVRPGRPASRVVMPLFFLAAMHLLTTRTPMGRRMRPRAQRHAAPVFRARPGDLAAAGVHRVGRVTGVHEGRPVTDEGTRLDVGNVIWCTGYQSDFSWIDLPAFRGGGEPAHDRGVIHDEAGLYLIGQRFQYALASSFIGGVGRDAAFVADVIARRAASRSDSRHPIEARTPQRS